MIKSKVIVLAGAMLALASAAALAAGLLTNGLPLVGAPSQNGATINPPNGLYTNVSPRNATVPVDTNLAAGLNPQSVSATAFQIAAIASELIANPVTSTVHAATSNTTAALVTTEALTTAAGATYTFTFTDSLLVAGAPAPLVAVYNGTNTGGALVVTSVTNATGSTVVVLTNNGTTALNGTILLAFHI